MFDPGPTLLTALVLGLGPTGPPPGELVEPSPRHGEPCVMLLLPTLYLGDPLEPCAQPPGQRTTPSPLVPLDLWRHSARDE